MADIAASVLARLKNKAAESGRSYQPVSYTHLDYKVPADQVFVMGDNRRVSLDSRSEEVGTVSEDSIVGKAFIRLYPFNQIKLL